MFVCGSPHTPPVATAYTLGGFFAVIVDSVSDPGLYTLELTLCQEPF